MFTAEERDRVRERLLARAEADGAIAGAAFTGSQATGDGDRWSDTDLVLAVRGELTPYAKGAHLLPDDLTAALTATLVRAPDQAELRRALAATIDVVTGELGRSDPGLAGRLRPMLAELAGSANVGRA
jgi:hypothetical protein